jgi:hypothetical protein
MSCLAETTVRSELPALFRRTAPVSLSRTTPYSRRNASPVVLGDRGERGDPALVQPVQPEREVVDAGIDGAGVAREPAGPGQGEDALVLGGDPGQGEFLGDHAPGPMVDPVEQHRHPLRDQRLAIESPGLPALGREEVHQHAAGRYVRDTTLINC